MLLGVDVGGTFTDAVLIGADSALHTAKVPSTPAEQSRGVLAAVRAVLADAGARPREVERFAHGMTVATNALLEGRTARTALVATEGFTDVVELGRQARPRLYELCVASPRPLAPPELRYGAPERMTPDGPLRALERDAAGALVARVAAAAPEAVAVVLLHSYAHPAHELLLGELLAELMPGTHVSLSHELVGTFREYERAASTEIDAALSPLLGSYLRRLGAEADALGLARPAVMQSSGGLTDAESAAAHAALTVLSGPAGGVRGAQLLAALAGERDVLCFDMGGTSCDVCAIHDGAVAETAAGAVAGRPLALATLDIETVGAGGGSIAWRDAGGALRVGPRSAGADPGPACYGRGGCEPTVTDANLLLGRLPVAGMSGLELDREAAARAIAELAARLGLSATRCAEGIVRVAEAEMLRALRVMSVQRGLDPRDFALLAFGGAGPLHACALARELGMHRILCPRAAGVLCALGLAAAAPRRDAARTVTLSGESFGAARLRRERELLLARASDALGEAPARVAVRYELRYRGQSFELPVAESELEAPHRAPPTRHDAPPRGDAPPTPDDLREAFARAHEERYGYRDDAAAVELVTIRASAWGAAPDRAQIAQCLRGESPRGAPQPGTRLRGPAICSLGESTLFVAPGWEGEVDAFGTVRLNDTAERG
ncbi:MAG TPA: hydantoinase/oxoprolinase family protein [Solirubrobacteraceae bacterium]|jgi:N-methylhydantoinase A|nr:hydantoinase/oxoprolinase family protein [Solirubrobacteraceae bacterium]